MELSNLPHMNSADESPASTESKDVAGTGWLWELEVLQRGFEEAAQSLEDL